VGAILGSLTYARFFVEGQTADDLRGSMVNRVRAAALQPLVADEDAEEHHGWCSITDPTSVDLAYEDFSFNEYVCLGLRVDRWLIPKPLLKAHLRDAEAEILKQKNLERLGRKARAELKLFVMRKLRRQVVPVTKTYDLVWDTGEGVCRVFSHSARVHLMLQELFEKTFRLRLVPESPGTAAERRGLGGTLSEAWDALEPTSLAEVP